MTSFFLNRAPQEARVVPASFGQASLWFVRQLMPYQSAYNTAIEIRLAGNLDAAALLGAVREVVRRHESFRTTFTTVAGTVHQVIREGTAADCAAVDLSSSADPEAEAQRLARAAAAAPFDLERGPLLRVRLVGIGPREHALVVVMDHIVADGMSLGILWREIEALYRAFHGGLGSPLPPPARQFAECVEAQNRWLTTPAYARQLAYWTKHLAGAAACALPEDRPRPALRSYRGDLAVIAIPAALTAGLRALSADRDVSLFASLLAGLNVLLARTSGQSNVVVMTPIASRQRFAAEAVIGYFANLVLLRTEVPDGLGFGELAGRVNKEIMAGVFRQDVPFEKVIEAVRPERSLSYDPLARVSLSFLPAHASALDLPGVQADYREIPCGGAKFDLSLIVIEHAEHLTVSVEYNTDVFDAGTMTAFLERYRLLLAAAVAAPDQPVGELPWLTAAEQAQLAGWNATARAYPGETLVHELFAAQAARTPEAVALRFEGREVRYGELDRRANQLAHALRKRGVGPDTLVGVLMERSVEMLVALYGVLKAGGAYVPLDPAYPRERLAFMLEDARAPVVLIQAHLASALPEQSGAVLRVDADWEAIAGESTAPPPRDGLTPRHLAYVIYTSGSTGRPKGAMNEHRGVLNRLQWMQRAYGLDGGERGPAEDAVQLRRLGVGAVLAADGGRASGDRASGGPQGSCLPGASDRRRGRDDAALRAVDAGGVPRPGAARRVRHGASGGVQRRGVAAGARGPLLRALPERRRARQPVRSHGGGGGRDRLGVRARGDPGAHRAPDRQRHAPRARRAPGAGADRRGGRALHRRGAGGSGVPQSPGADGRALRPRSLREPGGRAAVPDGRRRALAAVRARSSTSAGPTSR